MKDFGKALLKADLEDRQRNAQKRLQAVQTNVLVSSIAVELWTQLNEPTEGGQATAARLAAKNEQQELEALITRLERGLAALDNL